MKARSSVELVKAKVKLMGLLMVKTQQTDEEKEIVFQLSHDDDVDQYLRKQSGRGN